MSPTQAELVNRLAGAVAESLDAVKLEEVVGRFAGDFGAGLHAATVLDGDQLGLYHVQQGDFSAT